MVMIAGEAVLVDDDGRHPMGPGDIAAFPKNDGNGHVLINESYEIVSSSRLENPLQRTATTLISTCTFSMGKGFGARMDWNSNPCRDHNVLA